MRLIGRLARMGKMRNAYKILIGKPGGKRPPGRTRSKWEDNIRLDLRKICLRIVYWMHTGHGRDQWRALP
jgi:hypothetical protein